MIQGFIRNRTLGSVVTRLSRVTCIVTSILTSVVTCHVCCHEYCHECRHVPGDDPNNETSVSVATVTESENVKVRYCQKRTCPSSHLSSPWPQTLSHKPYSPKTKTKGPWADTKLLQATTTTTTRKLLSMKEGSHNKTQ